MQSRVYTRILAAFLVAGCFLSFPCAAAAEDPCAEEGIIVKNLTLRSDLWYRRDTGDCFLLRRHNIIRIKPDETLQIFSDLVCETPYSADPPTYTHYKYLDRDGDCKIRVLPGGNLSDM